ncbi:MAG: hypothetical protein K0Q72_5233 [Armatimonadetes bacterium]|nr:hypothetical protein [Armatimonadota bacterium]
MGCQFHGPSLPRRSLLQVGALGGLGLSLTGLETAQAAGRAKPATIRTCILIFHYGGPSHLDTWDMKPDAPVEIRGEFRAIDTSAPGVRISEHLPLTAKAMHHVAVVRSMHHPMRNHNAAAVEALCGRTPLGGDQELLADTSLSFPSYGSVVSWLERDAHRELSHVALPHVMYNGVRLPGQTAGFLGSRYEPYQVESDPSRPNFNPGQLSLPAGFSASRLSNREALLAVVDRQLDATERLRRADLLSIPYARAFALLQSDRVRRAFDISAEPAAVKERYGLNKHGQSVLLARRLAEAGVGFITVFDGIYNGQEANWDSHQAVFKRHRDVLLPPADRAFSALVEDLSRRGMLDETLVVSMGEFGRTPKINKDAGRDHWPDCYSIALAGGGVRGGTLYGSSDPEGAYPASDPVTPGDLAATLFWRFGLDWKREMRDGLERPYPAAEGEPLRKLFG